MAQISDSTDEYQSIKKRIIAWQIVDTMNQ
jgi:hypothetical protein